MILSTFLIIICVPLFIFVIWVLYQDEIDSSSAFVGFVFAVILFLIITGIHGLFFKEPEAIDVYRGNTTLQITYRDSIPVDRVVIFKNNIK